MATRIPDEFPGRPLPMLLSLGAVGGLSDGQLLERFNAGRGESSELAFAALVERHGPMVLRVARGLLPDRNDADDAFQATFLVLAGRARRLWVRDSLGPWLHQTAHRTARCLRATAARRRRLDLRIARTDEAPEPVPVADHDDLARTLHEEIDRLPDRYRIPVVLCDLEGRTHEQAARALGWPVGTVKSRQARARQRLGERLRRRGLAPGASLPALLGPAVPEPLLHQTLIAALRFPLSRAVAPGTAAALARGVLRSMSLTPWIKIASLGLVVGLSTTSAGWVAHGAGQAPPAQDPPPQSPPTPPPAAAASEKPTVEDKSLIPVQPGRFQRALVEPGRVEYRIVQEAVSEVEGETTLLEIKPDRTNVRKGEVIARLDSSTFQDQLEGELIAERKAALARRWAEPTRANAELALEEFTKTTAPLEQKDHRNRVDDAKARLEKGQARRERALRARARADEINRARTGPETVADVAANLDIDDRLEAIELEISSLRRELERAETQDALFQTTASRTRKRLVVELGQARDDELAREAELTLSRARVARLRQQIRACTLVADHDGQVLHNWGPLNNTLPVQPGAGIRLRQKIYSLIDWNRPFAISTAVGEPLVDRITIGQKVKVADIGGKGPGVTGIVESVAPRMVIPPSGNKAEGTYPVRISLEGHKGSTAIQFGSEVVVSIPVGEIDNVVSVPIQALYPSPDSVPAATTNDIFSVLVMREDAGELRRVRIGLSNGEFVEIKAGLTPGERVRLNPINPVPPLTLPSLR